MESVSHLTHLSNHSCFGGCREFKRRKEEGEFQLVMNEESTQNYQKKILPWEEIEVDHEK